MSMTLLGVFAGIALLSSADMVSLDYIASIQAAPGEIGVRMALGAQDAGCSASCRQTGRMNPVLLD